ncbi:MAG: PAS domain S-box protein [Gemmataceae bacterium]|nr:PAS domain S-box protein [Gemmataceae bacterium]
MDFIAQLFDTTDFPPRWHCGVWSASHGWLHIVSDLAVWGAYVAIPIVLAFFVKQRRDLPFRAVFLLFVAFIFACGTTHLMEAIIFWWPAYRLAGVIKLFTAVVSWGTVFALIPIVPRVLAMRSPEELEREVKARRAAEAELQRANATLEAQLERVRTSEERFRLLVEGAKDYAIYMLDPEGKVASWNQGAERLKGYAASEIIGSHFSKFYPPEDASKAVEELGFAKDHGRREDEGWRVRKDGSKFWANVIVTPLLDASGQLRGFSKLTRDVTERRSADENARRLFMEETRRKAAEEQADVIRQQAELLRVTLASIGDGVITTDDRGQVAFANAVAESLTGWKADEAKGKPLDEVFRIVREEDGEPAENPVDKVLREGCVVGLANHTLLVPKSGPRCPIDDSAAPIRDASGNIIGVVLVFRDGTERHRAESLLSGQKRALELIVEGASTVEILEHLCDTVEEQLASDAVATVLLANAQGTHLRPAAGDRCPGIWSHQIDPLPISEGVGSCGSAAFAKTPIYANDIETDPRWSAFLDLARPHGFRACWSNPILSSRGDVLGTFALYHFVPKSPTEHDYRLMEVLARTAGIALERRQADETLRESEERFRVMADNLPQLAWMAEPNGNVFWHNRRWHEYTGRGVEEMQREGWQSVVDPKELPKLAESLGKSFATGEPWEDTVPLRRQDGQYRWHLSRVLPIRDEQAKVVRWLGTNTDITERLDMENALRQADRQKDEFLATLAHELRNPMAPIRNGVFVLHSPNVTPQVMQSVVQMMDRQIENLVRLVDDLLDVSRITRGKIDLKRSRIDLAHVIDMAAETSRPLLETQKHRLHLEVNGSLPVWGDSTRLAQVISNLLNNAAKFTPVGGNVWLTAEAQGGHAVIRVRDDGIGIPASEMGRVFEMFAQVRRGGTEASGGLGIGLTLARRLVEMHGGTLSVRSDGESRGSEFSIRLPLLEPTASESPSQMPGEPNGEFLPRRILVVDDSEDSAESLAMLLRFEGHLVITAADGVKAIEAAKSFGPELILLDIGMPGMDGYEVARSLRQMPEMRQTILVAQTGWGQEEDRRRTTEAGFDAHLVKPIDPSELKRIIASPRD